MGITQISTPRIAVTRFTTDNLNRFMLNEVVWPYFKCLLYILEKHSLFYDGLVFVLIHTGLMNLINMKSGHNMLLLLIALICRSGLVAYPMSHCLP